MEVLGIPARQAGRWLMAFGVIGLVLTIVLAVVWLGAFGAAADLDERLEADRLAAADTLHSMGDLLDSTADAVEATTASFDSVQAALDDTARLLTTMSGTTAELAAALDVTILGQQPLGEAAEAFAEISEELATFATHARELAANLDEMGPALDEVATDVRTIEASVTALADRLEAYDGIERLVAMLRLYALLSALLAVWTAVLAGGCVWAGRRLMAADRLPAGESNPTN